MIFPGIAIIIASFASGAFPLARAGGDLKSQYQLLEKANSGTIPIDFNESVMESIRETIDSKERRSAFEAALTRMDSARSKLAPILIKNKLPKDLLEIALTQSNFENLKPKTYEGGSNAGIWYLSIQTANAYELRTEPDHDDRRDEKKSTESAANLLALLHQRFPDWRDVIVAYCQGQGLIENQRELHEKISAWEIEVLAEPNFHCLTRTMATAFLTRHRELLSPK